MQKAQLRIAPTPSGYLHLGNVLNFMLVQRLAQALDAEVTLRIDDLDALRARDGYQAFIFQVLRHLGIQWQHGPQHIGEAAEHSQWTRIQQYWSTLQALAEKQLLYPCTCTRQELEMRRQQQNTHGTTACPCFAQQTIPEPAHILETIGFAPASIQEAKPQLVAWRLHPELRQKVAFGTKELWSWQDVPPIMLRKEGIPAYHVASVSDDVLMNMTHIVRGHDLLESSATQVVLAKALGHSTYLSMSYLHHELLSGVGALGVEHSGHKLSKSAGANAQGMLPTVREVELLDECVSTVFQVNHPYVARLLV